MTADNKAVTMIHVCVQGGRKGYPSIGGRSWGSGLGQIMGAPTHTMLGRWKDPFNPV